MVVKTRALGIRVIEGKSNIEFINGLCDLINRVSDSFLFNCSQTAKLDFRVLFPRGHSNFKHLNYMFRIWRSIILFTPTNQDLGHKEMRYEMFAQIST